MDERRKLELLAYAKVCFEHCTNPFETIHLLKKKVSVNECKDLSQEIANVIEDDLLEYYLEAEEVMSKAEKEFQETQE